MQALIILYVHMLTKICVPYTISVMIRKYAHLNFSVTKEQLSIQLGFCLYWYSSINENRV